MAVRKLAPALPQVTAEEVEAAKKACANARRLYGVHRGAERARDAALAQIFFKMGFTALDEVKAMAPERLAAEIQKRAGVEFSFDSAEAREFAVLKTWQGCFLPGKINSSPASALRSQLRSRNTRACSTPMRSSIRPPRKILRNVVYLPKRASK